MRQINGCFNPDTGLILKVRLTWWLPLYVWAVKWFYVVTGVEPDWDKVQQMVNRVMRITAH